MKTASIKSELIAQIDRLPQDLQVRLLDFAKTLEPKGVKGKSLIRFEGTISADDLGAMSKAIEEDCEKIDVSEW